MAKNTTAMTLLATLGALTFGAQAGVTDDISAAVKASTVNLDLRYRYETNDQDNGLKDATASTLKTRLTIKTGKVNDFSAVIEVDHVAQLGAGDYDDKVRNRTGYLVGRQRLAHNGHRFLGTVGWRQNEQTYDAYRVQVQATDAVNIDYSFIYNTNGITGGNTSGDFHALNVKYAPAQEHKFAFFAYLLDFASSTASKSDTDTLGVDYQFATKLGQDSKIGVNLSYAMQSDSNDNTTSYDASYSLAEVNGSMAGIFGGVGIEVLGSGNFASFSTPFATKHKFNGWADMFLKTPDKVLEDLYFKIGTKVGGVKLTAIYHEFTANETSADYGTELDLVASYKLNKQVGLLAKYASYDADTHKVDTDKLWIMATVKL